MIVGTRKNSCRQRRGTQGFTLIAMAVVFVVIGMIFKSREIIDLGGSRALPPSIQKSSEPATPIMTAIELFRERAVCGTPASPTAYTRAKNGYLGGPNELKASGIFSSSKQLLELARTDQHTPQAGAVSASGVTTFQSASIPTDHLGLWIRFRKQPIPVCPDQGRIS